MADKSLGFNITALDKASKTFVKLGETVDRLERKLNDLDRTKADPKVTVDTRRAERDIGTFAAKMHARLDRAIRSLPDVKLGIDANTDAASRAILRVKRQMESLRDKTVGVDIDATTAQRQMAALSRELTRLGAQHPDIQVRADTAAASAALATVSAQARRLDGRDVTIGVGVQNIARAISMMGLLTAGIAAVGAAAPAAAAAVAAIPGAAAAAGQGIGALAVGFSGVGDAVKALSDAETEAAAGTSAAADTRVAAAERVQSAQQALSRAQTAADRASVTGAAQVADARRGVADAVASAARRVENAERGLASAQRTARQAQQDLTRARADAREELEDLNLSLRDAALSEEEAVLRLRQAREDLTEARAAGAGGDDIAELDLAVRRAALGVDQARERYGDLRAEQSRWARDGVDGSDRVASAQQRVADANRGVADAQQALAAAQRDGAREVADANRSLARAQQAAAWAQRDATAQVADAQRALASAMRETGAAGSASGDKIKEAFANLGPEAQAFARFLASDFLPRLREIRGAVQATLLPRMQQSLQNLTPLLPVLSDGLAETGRVLGDLGVRGSEMMASGPWRADFATIMAGNNRILDDFGTSGLSVADAFRNITVAALPMIERFSEFTRGVSEQFAAWIEGKRQTGDLQRWFAEMGDRLAELGGILKQVAVGVWDLSQALAPMGMVILETIGNTIEMIGEFARAHPTITQMAAAGVLLYSSFISIGKLFAGIGAASALAVGGFQKFGAALALMVPANLNTKLQTMTGLIDANQVATQRAATRTGGFVRGLTRAASYAPIAGAALVGLGVAYDKLVVSSDEAADAINAGGLEAEKARERIGVLERGTAGWLSFLRPLITTQDEATAAAKAQYDAYGPLAQAQRDVERAQADYDLVLRDHPPTSDEAKAAAERLATAQGSLKSQTQQASDAGKRQIDVMLEQAETMRTSLDADYAYREAKRRLTEQQQALNTAIAEHGPNSAQAREQMFLLEGQMIRLAEVAGRRAAANYTDKTSVDAVKASNRAYNEELARLVFEAGTAAPQALVAYIANLSASEQQAIGARVETDRFGNRVLNLQGKHVPITTNAAEAAAEVDRLRDAIQRLRDMGPTHATIIADVIEGRGARTNTGNAPGLVGRAAGGPIRGPGTGTSDSIPAMLSDDEHVWTAREVHGAGGHGRVARLRGLAAIGQLPAFAGGGPVGMQRGGMIRAEDGSWVPPSFYAGAGGTDMAESARESLDALRELVAGGINPLSERLQRALAPALERAGELAGTDTVDAVKALMGSLLPLTATTEQTGRQQRATWQANTRQVQWAQQTQTGQYRALQTNLNAATVGMSRSVFALQGNHNRSWFDMRAVTGREVGTITGPIFGGLHRGMDAVQGHGDRMSGAFGAIMGRIRQYTADPIRWSLQWPINRGLQPAWAEIDRFFALRRPWRGVPIGFATGGPVFGGGTETSDSIPARLSRDEHVWTAREVKGAGGHDEIERMRHAAASGTLALFAKGGPVLPGYAIGGGVRFGGIDRQMAAIIERGVPGARISSAYRPGDSGYHGRGKAIDIGSPEAASNRWIARHYPNSTQLIYTPGVNLLNGRPHRYNAATRADHYDHCVPLDVRILTRRGWLAYDELVEGDETPGFNFDTQKTEWTPITDISVFDDAEVTEAASRGWSVRSTSAHRWIARNSETGRHFWTTTGGDDRWPWRVAAPMADGPGVDLTDDEAELLGWLVTDGSQWEARQGKVLRPLRKGYPDGAAACFSMFVWQSKSAGVSRLDELLAGVAARNRSGYRLYDSYARGFLVRAGLTHIKNPDELLAVLGAMTGRQRAAMLAGVLGGDGVAGTIGARGKPIGQRIYQEDGPLVDMLSTLVYYCGYRARVTKRDTGTTGYNSDGVHMTISLSQPYVSTRRQGRLSLGRMRVWCPTTELGSWTAQFDGNPVLTGNSHWAMENAAMLGNPQLGAGALPAVDIRKMIEPYFRRTRQLIGDIRRFHGTGNIAAGMTRMGNDSVEGAISQAERLMAVMGPGPGSGVERWRGVGLRSLAIARQPASNIGRLLMQMDSESGGDPNVVNRWDSNWAKGTPSVGLMQVIGPTYRAHKHPAYDVGPYKYGTSVNPLSNVLAATRYTLARYGSLARGWQGRGYDDGGILAHGQGGWNMSGRPERVLDPDQTRAFERLVNVLDTRQLPRAVAAVPSFDQLFAAMSRSGGGSDAGGPLIGSLQVTTTPQATADQIIGAAMHRVRAAKFGSRRR